MMVGSYYYKLKAKEALKGNWQNAMLVAFFSGVLGTVLQVLQMVLLPGQSGFATVEAYADALLQVPMQNWLALLLVSLLALLISPALGLGCNHYFVQLTRKNDLGFSGLFSRIRLLGKGLWLYLRMAVQIFLWSLLLVVPGIIAAVRYSMAPYYLAENPDISVQEAFNRSKASMEGRKLSFFSLMVSFVGWSMLALLLEIYLGEISYVLGIVASLALQVWVAAYQNGAVAVFYRSVSEENGISRALDEMMNIFTEYGMDPDAVERMRQEAERQKQPQPDATAEGEETPSGQDEDELD